MQFSAFIVARASLLIFLGFYFNSATCQSTYRIDPERSEITFTIKNMGFTVDGSFSGLTGKLRFDPENPSDAYFSASLPAKTIDTDNNTRDRHLREEDYFHVAQYPEISFKSTQAISADEGDATYIAIGALSLRGVKREKRIRFERRQQEDGSYVYEGELQVNRLNYGIGGESLMLSNVATVRIRAVALPE